MIWCESNVSIRVVALWSCAHWAEFEGEGKGREGKSGVISTHLPGCLSSRIFANEGRSEDVDRLEMLQRNIGGYPRQRKGEFGDDFSAIEMVV